MCVCATTVPHDFSVSAHDSEQSDLINPFAIEHITALTVFTSVARSLSLSLSAAALYTQTSAHECHPTPFVGSLTSGYLIPLWASPSSPTNQGHVSHVFHRSEWDMPLDKRAAWPRPSNQWRPSLLWHLLQYLEQQVTEGLGHIAVTCRRQVKEVKHVLLADGSIRVDKLSTHVQ